MVSVSRGGGLYSVDAILVDPVRRLIHLQAGCLGWIDNNHLKFEAEAPSSTSEGFRLPV
jgi:hypothetical protein